MKVIRNTTQRPLRVPLPGGKLLHLGPAQSARVSGDALARAELRRLVAEGTLEITGEESRGTFADEEVRHLHASTAGHHPRTVVVKKGDR
jgi:hypothetical protein